MRAGDERASVSGPVPEARPFDVELSDERAQGRQREPDDGRGVALDAAYEGPAETVDGERSGDGERFAGGDVCVDLGGVELGEVHGCGIRSPDCTAHAAASVVDEPVTRPEHPGAAVLGVPAFARDVGLVRFAMQHPVDEKCGVAAEDEPVDRVAANRFADDRFGFGTCEQLHEIGGGEWSVCGFVSGDGGRFVNAGCDRRGFDSGGAQGLQSGGRGRGEVEAHASSLPRRARPAQRASRVPDAACSACAHRLCDARLMSRSRRPRPRGAVPTGARRSRSKPLLDVAEMPVFELEVERIAHGGIAVARHEGRVVFVADAVPGERVRARVYDTGNDRFWRADTLDVLEASPDRREHVWVEAGLERDPVVRAGGAEFGHIAMARQRSLKSEVLRDALQRFGGVGRAARGEADAAAVAAESGIVDALEVVAVEAELAPGVDVEAGTGWRTRVRLHVDADGTVGPYAARSHRVVPVASLPLAVDELAALAELSRVEHGGADTAIDLVAPSVGEPFAIVVEREGREGREVAGRRGARRVPATAIEERVGARAFALDRGGFWQVHRGAAATLGRAVQQMIDVDRFDERAANHDLYGGVGLLAAAVGDRFGAGTHITTVESDPLATEHARANLAEWGDAVAVTARVEGYLAELLDAASVAERRRLRDATIVLDPPRSGAGRQVVECLTELAPRQLVYVACDPVALARDVGLLRERGYRLDEVRAFDLFPNTHHVEAVARLSAIV